MQAPAGPKPTLHGPPWTVITPAKEGDRSRKGGNAGYTDPTEPQPALHDPPWTGITPAKEGDRPRKGGNTGFAGAPAGPKPALHGPPWTAIASASEGDGPYKGGNTGYVGNRPGGSPPCAARHSSDRRARTASAEPARRCRKTIMTAAQLLQSATPTAFPKRLQAASRRPCRIGVGSCGIAGTSLVGQREGRNRGDGARRDAVRADITHRQRNP